MHLKWKRSTTLVLVSVAFTFLSLGLLFLLLQKNSDAELNVYIGRESPFSLDPLEFDYSQHIPIQSAVNGNLISGYRGMRIFPAIAEGWTSSNSDTEWRFKIREDVRFSDGEKISPKSVVESFRRIFFKLKEKKSSNKLLSRLKDVQSLKTASSSFQGIASDGNDRPGVFVPLL